MAEALAERARGGVVLSRRWRWGDPRTVALVGGAAYFVVVLLGLLWAWGSPQPDQFSNPDESTNRLAASLVAETGSPVQVQPFQDTEDLVHLRGWYSIDGEARSVYPPLTYYLYGYGMRIGGPGEWLPLLAAASGVAALAAAGALALSRRPWFGVLLPLVAYPFTFWVIHPWHNAGLAYAFLSVAVLLFVLWAREGRQRYFVASTALIALAGATRPDLLLYLFGGLYLIALYLRPGSWRRITLTLAAGGCAAVALIALLNWAVVGDPLRSGYQAAAAQPYWSGESTADRLPTPFQELAWALAPWGIRLGGELAAHLAKAWLILGPIAPISVGAALGYWSLLRRSKGPWLLLAIAALFALFVTSRYCPDCYGADKPVPGLEQSNSRYLAVAYLLAAFSMFNLFSVPPQSRWFDRLTTGSLVTILAFMALVFGLYIQSDHDIRDEHQHEAQLASAALPEGTVLYTRIADAYLWNVPGIVSAYMPAEFPRDPEMPPEAVPAEAFDRLERSMRASYASGHATAVMGIHEDYVSVLQSRLAPELQLVPLEGLDHAWMIEPAQVRVRDSFGGVMPPLPSGAREAAAGRDRRE